MTLTTRILARVTEGAGGCWLWSGSCDRGGYGQITVNGKHLRAHRVAYEAFVGPIPDGLQLDHLCRVRACVNPEHLEPVTARVNALRGESFSAVNAAKTHCKNGHALDAANTYIRPSGNRSCRMCNAEAQRRRAQRRKLAA